MPIDVTTWDETPANNSTVDGVNIAEACPPANMNNMGRAIMAGVKTFKLAYDTLAATVVTLATPQTLTNKTLTSPTITGGTIVLAAAPVAAAPGLLGLPQSAKTASYTLALANCGYDIYVSGVTAAQTVTIPANATVAFPVGAFVQITNDSNQNWSIAITTDVMLWSPSSGTGTRTLAAGGQATVRKVTATRWWISGVGLT